VKFILSRHAIEEMRRRQIPRQLLESVLNNPEQRIPQPGGKEIFQSRLKSARGKMYVLRAVLAVDKDPAVVVTVYRTTKIAKYWRPQ